MSTIRVCAYAKINLTLDIVRRLPSGYHELRSVMQQVDLCDEVTLALSADGISLTCDNCAIPADQTNLAWRAAELMRERYCPGQGVRLHLHKRIPVGGGLAGGSADAAAVLLGLNQLWDAGLGLPQLVQLGAELGMDVPFCLLGGTALATGRGELVEPLPHLPALGVVIVHPGFSVSTREAFAGLDGAALGNVAATETMLRAVQSQDVRQIAAGLHNAFEASLRRRAPQIDQIKRALLAQGALNAVLTGSGACVFGLCPSQAEAERVAGALRGAFPQLYVARTHQAGPALASDGP